jgi:hypothetical protein
MNNPFPTTTKAIAILQNDTGCILRFAVIAQWHDKLPEVEEQLSRLSQRPDGFSELDDFVIGDEEKQKALRRKYDLGLAHKFLEDIFDAARS